MSGGEGTNLNSKQRRVKKGRRHFTRYVHNYTWYTISSSFKNQKHPKLFQFSQYQQQPDLDLKKIPKNPNPDPKIYTNFSPTFRGPKSYLRLK